MNLAQQINATSDPEFPHTTLGPHARILHQTEIVVITDAGQGKSGNQKAGTLISTDRH
jgi:hypothetical protein